MNSAAKQQSIQVIVAEIIFFPVLPEIIVLDIINDV
jgi:hypothetical protein